MRRLVIVLLLILAMGLLSLWIAGGLLSRPAQAKVGQPPSDLPARSVTLPYAQGQSLSGWYLPGVKGQGAVLLLHGVRSDRRQMVGRARFLHRHGYSVLLVDLPAHGESLSPNITFGVNESGAVKAALAYLAQALPSERIGVIGVSLGAASLVLAKTDPAPAAVVLESMYPTLREAVSDRLRLHLGAWAEPLMPLLLSQMPLRLGISAEQLQPIADLPALHAPLLIASGAQDQHTTLAETKRLYQAANAPKTLWIVEGAAHVDLHAYDPITYEARILPFLDRHLRGVSSPLLAGPYRAGWNAAGTTSAGDLALRAVSTASGATTAGVRGG